jgi:hypothetical protein
MASGCSSVATSTRRILTPASVDAADDEAVVEGGVLGGGLVGSGGVPAPPQAAPESIAITVTVTPHRVRALRPNLRRAITSHDGTDRALVEADRSKPAQVERTVVGLPIPGRSPAGHAGAGGVTGSRVPDRRDFPNRR